MSISNEAIEAGARILIEDGQFGVPWEDASDDDRTEAVERVRVILEAAAPLMLAKAWDEAHFEAIGCDSSCCDYMHGAPNEDMNPYRPEPSL
jgi:hypothetical protein